MQKVCEDCQSELDDPTQAHILDAILPTFIMFFEHPSPKIRFLFRSVDFFILVFCLFFCIFFLSLSLCLCLSPYFVPVFSYVNRSYALGCTNQFIISRSQALTRYMMPFVEVAIFC